MSRTVNFAAYPSEIASGTDNPYAWKTPKEGVRRLEALDRLTCQIGFDLHLYQRK